MAVVRIEPLAVAFANTRSSDERDRIATLGQFRQWARSWPGLARFLSDIDAAALQQVQLQRDATQAVLHQLAAMHAPPPDVLARATRPGLAAAPFALVSAARNSFVVPGKADPASAVIHVLSRALVDLLLAPEAADIRRCQGAGCRKVFIGRRAERRWCDSQVCGNRARVAAHARNRQRTSKD